MPFVNSALTVTALDDIRWMLEEPLLYEGRRERFPIPAGYITDLASRPRIVAWLVARHARYSPAMILHDYLITERYYRAIELGQEPMAPNDIDGLFRRVLRELDVPPAMRWYMWTGVRWGSLASGRSAGWATTAPAVLALSVLALPVVALGVPGVVAGLLVYQATEYAVWLLGGARGPAPTLNWRT